MSKRLPIQTTAVALALCALMASAGWAAGPVPAPDPVHDPIPTADRAWGLDVGAEYASRYLFRGVSQLGDEAVYVPHARYGYGHLAVYFWGYLGNVPDFGDDRYREADFGLDYTFSFGERVAMTVGAVTYQYNGPAERDIVFLDTYEFYTVVTIDTVLTPTISFYRDVHAVDGGYLSAAISHTFELGDRMRLILSGSAGFDFGYNNKEVGDGTFNDVLLGADLPIRLTDDLSMHAMVQRTIAQSALDRSVSGHPGLKAFYGDQTVVSAGLTYSF